MTALPVLLDTDILSAIMRQDRVVIPKAQTYLIAHERFTFSIITRYEILRGLKAKGATKQLAAFDRFCNLNTVLPPGLFHSRQGRAFPVSWHCRFFLLSHDNACDCGSLCSLA